MDQPPSGQRPGAVPPASPAGRGPGTDLQAAPPGDPPLIAEQPQARLFGVPVIIWVLIVFVIVVAILAWLGFVSGDML